MARTTDRSVVIDAILDTLVVGAIVSSVLVAPNVAQIFGKMYDKRMGRRTREREAKALLQYMKRQGVVRIVKRDGQFTIDITPKGMSRLERHRLQTLAIPQPSAWDGKWRIVMFDIPQEYDVARRAFARKLQALGFKLMQRSVWVHPFPCFEEVGIVTSAFPEVVPYVLVAEVGYVNVHDKLLEMFAKQLALTK
jgi:hypothetical protein